MAQSSFKLAFKQTIKKTDSYHPLETCVFSEDFLIIILKNLDSLNPLPHYSHHQKKLIAMFLPSNQGIVSIAQNFLPDIQLRSSNIFRRINDYIPKLGAPHLNRLGCKSQ
ncbi:MAG: Unknown protein [uncultured Thiotrichaceae bacterium]|uniref:Uncharacterized protein n=1 Tax=uncultured Thiotrichaceae bacterium TaxID=298394 RepID=A0A6S6UB53_9GAMM|nr:MAG: Unknown protein [uncultured Thiotrichaceae bacterium]